MELEAWIQGISSRADAPIERVAIASAIADAVVRYIDALDASNADAARAELSVLRELCQERIAALGSLPKRSGPMPTDVDRLRAEARQ